MERSSTITLPLQVGSSFVPNDTALAKLATDSQHMVDDGLFLDDVEAFDALMERCRAIQQKTNAKRPPP